MAHLIHSFLADEEGATAVEYGLLLSLIAGVSIAAIGGIGYYLNQKFTKMSDQLAR